MIDIFARKQDPNSYLSRFIASYPNKKAAEDARALLSFLGSFRHHFKNLGDLAHMDGAEQKAAEKYKKWPQIKEILHSERYHPAQQALRDFWNFKQKEMKNKKNQPTATPPPNFSEMADQLNAISFRPMTKKAYIAQLRMVIAVLPEILGAIKILKDLYKAIKEKKLKDEVWTHLEEVQGIISKLLKLRPPQAA